MRIRCAKLLALVLAACAMPVLAAGVEDSLAVIVPAGSSHRLAGREALAAVYRRKKQYWDDGQRIEALNLPAEDPRRQRFSQIVLGLTPQQLDTYWSEMYFHGVLPPHVLASVEAVLRLVSDTPAAIGYVPLCNADARVSILFVFDADGKAVEKPSLEACPR